MTHNNTGPRCNGIGERSEPTTCMETEELKKEKMEVIND